MVGRLIFLSLFVVILTVKVKVVLIRKPITRMKR
jgi:hypothetical protein